MFDEHELIIFIIRTLSISKVTVKSVAIRESFERASNKSLA